MDAIEQLKSVLCDPEGKCCIAGSDEDRAIIDRALQALAQRTEQEPVGCADLIKRLRETANKGVSAWGDLQIEAAQELEILMAEREFYASAMDRMLAQPEQEPVAWMTINAYGEEDDIHYENPEGHLLEGWTYKPLYTHPPSVKLRRGDILRCIETDELCTVWSTSTTGKTLIKWSANNFGNYTAEQIGELFWLEPKQEIEQEPVYHLRQYGDVTKEQLDRYIETGDINPPAQPPQRTEQEPVAILNHAHGVHTFRNVNLKGLPDGEYLVYTHPPQRTEQEPLIGCVNHDCDKCKLLKDERLELIGHADLAINNIYIFNGYGEDVPEDRTPIYAGYKAAHGIKETT
jgi:hypothetical protein